MDSRRLNSMKRAYASVSIFDLNRCRSRLYGRPTETAGSRIAKFRDRRNGHEMGRSRFLGVPTAHRSPLLPPSRPLPLPSPPLPVSLSLSLFLSFSSDHQGVRFIPLTNPFTRVRNALLLIGRYVERVDAQIAEGMSCAA